MDDDYTPLARRVLDYARRHALRRAARAVEPIDLAAGLLVDQESAAGRLLSQSLAPDSILATSCSQLSEEPSDQTDLPIHDALSDVVLRARTIAAQRGAHDAVESDHLLIALFERSKDMLSHFPSPALAQHLADHERQASAPISLETPAEVADLFTDAETTDLARIVDAVANRLREALRVVEDHCRFVLNDSTLSEQLKGIRHEVRSALSFLPDDWLRRAREVAGDVGRVIETADEHHRANLHDVAIANLKRAQEALRSLEEHAKIEDSRAARAFERLRYQSYEIERRLSPPEGRRSTLARARLYWLLDPAQCPLDLDDMVKEACAGGVDVVQLRVKNVSDREWLGTAERLGKVVHRAGALFIVNDRADLARLADADGVHLGQDDLPFSKARRLLRPDRLIGVSTHEQEQAAKAISDGADYLGVGPVFDSRTKRFDQLAGLSYVASCQCIQVPWFAIGGINLDNLETVLAAGARRVAIGAALTLSSEPRRIATRFRSLLETIPA